MISVENNKIDIEKISKNPGCYIFRNPENEVIYIGKAKNLKKRILQHFQKKTKNFVSKISNLKTIVTKNSKEALILEQNLIKKYQPRYNILLKSSSNYYPYIVIDEKSNPKYKINYKRSNKENETYFGPFPDGSKARETISLLEKIFPLSKCDKTSIKQRKPCIYYEMGQCSGSCFKEVPKDYYDSIKKELSNFFSGKTRKIKKKIEEIIKNNNRNFFFEESKKQKKILDSIDFLTSEQNIETKSLKSKDFWGIFEKEDFFSIVVFAYKKGKFLNSYEKLIDSSNYFEEKEEIIESFLVSFYENNFIPQKIVISKNFPYQKELSEFLKTEINKPRNEQEVKILESAIENSKEFWKNSVTNKKNWRQVNKAEVLENIKEFLNLKKFPAKIEALDISNISLEDSVGCFSFFLNGNYKSSKFYNLKEKKSSDHEYVKEACKMHFLKNKIGDIDLLIIDGGKSQLEAAMSFFAETNEKEFQIISLVKDLNHKTSKIINSKMEELAFPNKEIKEMMSNIQEKVHEKAIGFHRKIHLRKSIEN